MSHTYFVIFIYGIIKIKKLYFRTIINFLIKYLEGSVKCGREIANDEIIIPGFTQQRLFHLNKEFKDALNRTKTLQTENLKDCTPTNVALSLFKECPSYVEAVSQLLFCKKYQKIRFNEKNSTQNRNLYSL